MNNHYKMIMTDIPPLISTRAFVLAIFSCRSRSRFSCASFALFAFSSASLSFAMSFEACWTITQTYGVAPKNWHNCLYALKLPNINRFLKLFHCQNQEKMCNNTITKDPTTPQMCRYTTLWNVKRTKKLCHFLGHPVHWQTEEDTATCTQEDTHCCQATIIN